ncbi:hypothetical protein, partial [Brevundimonas sp. TWP3-1-2b1]|uniref:hypothetical protein n=1 Tax=Brevundimonas sp. TWP3-1-2b1 TaxID=2804650 RepID=UPI003CF1AA69
LLAQDPDDLLFRKSRSLHSVRPFEGRTLAIPGGVSGGHVSFDDARKFMSFQNKVTQLAA